jgi:hypothetical protein
MRCGQVQVWPRATWNSGQWPLECTCCHSTSLEMVQQCLIQPYKQITDQIVVQVFNIISNTSSAFHHLAFFASLDHHLHLLRLIVPIKYFINLCKGPMLSKMPNLMVHF